MSIIPISLKAPDLLIQAVFDGRRLGLQLFNISGMAARLSKAGAWWCPGRRMWVLEQCSADYALVWLQALYLREHVDFDGAAALLKAAIRTPEPDYFTQLLDVQIFELARGELKHGQHAVSFSYDGLCVRAMRALQGRFHKPAAAWQVRGDVVHIQHVLRDLAGVAAEFSFVHEQPVVLEDLVSPSADESPIQVPAATPEQGESGPAQDVDGAGFLSADLEQSNAVDIDEAVLAAIAVGAGLRDYQVDGVRHLAGQTGACLGDDMDLGKTRQSVVGAHLAVERFHQSIASVKTTTQSGCSRRDSSRPRAAGDGGEESPTIVDQTLPMAILLMAALGHWM